MGTAVWEQLRASFSELESDTSIRGVIFASGLRKDVFTAGQANPYSIVQSSCSLTKKTTQE